MFNRHVSKQLSAYSNGELQVEESRSVAEHLLNCQRCRKQYEEIRLGVRVAQQLQQVSAPESLWDEMESLLDREEARRQHPQAGFSYRPRRYRPRLVAAAVALIVLAVVLMWYLARQEEGGPQYVEAPQPATQREQPAPPAPEEERPRQLVATGAWNVERVEGTPQIGSQRIEDGGRIAVGQWLETDATSRAKIDVADIGFVQVDPNSRVRLVRTRPTEHRLALARGTLHAQIYAPPRLFFVDTPSAVAVDYGCSYTLSVDDAGASVLRVTGGWVALVRNGRESRVPAGAVCVTRPGVGPGTPYFEDASEEFRTELTRFDFEGGGRQSLLAVLSQARERDTLTLIQLLARVGLADRTLVYEQLAALVPPPEGVTRSGVLRLNPEMLEQWMMQLTWVW